MMTRATTLPLHRSHCPTQRVPWQNTLETVSSSEIFKSASFPETKYEALNGTKSGLVTSV